MTNKKYPFDLIVVLGATATGKTHLAVKIADQLNGEIISVDGGINASVGLPFFTEEMFTYLEKAVPNDMAKRIIPDES